MLWGDENRKNIGTLIMQNMLEGVPVMVKEEGFITLGFRVPVIAGEVPSEVHAVRFQGSGGCQEMTLADPNDELCVVVSLMRRIVLLMRWRRLSY